MIWHLCERLGRTLYWSISPLLCWLCVKNTRLCIVWARSCLFVAMALWSDLKSGGRWNTSLVFLPSASTSLSSFLFHFLFVPLTTTPSLFPLLLILAFWMPSFCVTNLIKICLFCFPFKRANLMFFSNFIFYFIIFLILMTYYLFLLYCVCVVFFLYVILQNAI